MRFCIIQLAVPRGIAQDVQHLKQEVSAVVWRTLLDEAAYKEVFLKATATLENIDININMQILFFFFTAALDASETFTLFHILGVGRLSI